MLNIKFNAQKLKANTIRPVLATMTASLFAMFLGTVSANTADASEMARVQLKGDHNTTELPNGVYLYGESPEANTLGSVYLVFTVEDNQVTGALYQPHSSFNCFTGQPEDGQLALTVTDSYSQEEYSHTIALDRSTLVASNNNVGSSQFNLEGLHRIGELSEMDKEILATCQAN